MKSFILSMTTALTLALIATSNAQNAAQPAAVEAVKQPAAPAAAVAPADAKPADAAATDASADAAPNADGEKADAAPAVPDLKLDFKPNSFQVNGYANYDDQGHVQNQSQNCSVYLKAFFNPQTNPIGYTDLQLTRIVADNGAVLQPLNNRNQSSFNLSRSETRPYFSVSLQLPFPPAAATGFTEISGKLNVQVGVGPIKRAVLPAFKDVNGNRVHIEGLGDNKDVWFKIYVQNQGNQQNQQIRMEMSNETFAQISEVKMVMPQGDLLTLQNNGYSRSDTVTTRYYQAPVTDDTRIVIEFYNKIEQVPATFSIFGLPLPGNPGRSEKDIVIQAVDAATAAAIPVKPGAAIPAPAGELKAIIEQADN